MSKDVPAFPPSYNAVTAQHASSGEGLTFCNFLPECLERKGIFSKLQFEPFSVLVDRANAWLAGQSQWEVKTCESVEFVVQREAIDPCDMVYYESGESMNRFTRGLRLWLVPRTDPTRPPQKIGYVNLVPQILGTKGFLGSKTVYENLDSLLDRFNTSLHHNPLPGRILTVETQEMKVGKASSFNPDVSSWCELGDAMKNYIFIIRVFYEHGEAEVEEIGLADFVPTAFKKQSMLSMPLYETFPYVLKRMSQWCAEQTSLRFCNTQSIRIKIKADLLVDTKRVSYFEYGSFQTYYIKVLRVAYVKTLSDTKKTSEGIFPPILHLNCKTFVPMKLKKGHWVRKYETLYQTRDRVEAWIKATGARVVGAETVPMPLFHNNRDELNTDNSLVYSDGTTDQWFIYVIRLYLDGSYEEPPKEVLPPEPVLQDSECTIV